MPECYVNYYQIGRNLAGLTMAQACEMIPCSDKSLYNYEHGKAPPPDAVVDRMAQVYGIPILAIWHMKHHTLLGKYLPEIVEPRTAGDMGFSVYISTHDMALAMEIIRRVLEDGKIDPSEYADLGEAARMMKVVAGRLMSAALYAEAEINTGQRIAA